MPILEKITQPLQARHWTDSIPLEYHYTAGVAGEQFRRELKETGRLLSSKCSKCKTVYIPARMFCPSCFIEIKENTPLEKPGYVYSHTTVNRNRAGEPIDQPLTMALIKFEGVKGGIVHRLQLDESNNVSFGTKVVPILRDQGERTGALTDIIAFKPQ
jgi:uncharacterized OB-fold protein